MFLNQLYINNVEELWLSILVIYALQTVYFYCKAVILSMFNKDK